MNVNKLTFTFHRLYERNVLRRCFSSLCGLKRAIKQDSNSLNRGLRGASQKKWLSASTNQEAKKTIDQEEVDKFSRIAHSWWDENGDLKALHTLNDLRIPFIRDSLYKEQSENLAYPLKGINIVDVGCGGGLLSEPLARLGAKVTGVDASQENIETAKWHASLDHQVEQNINYRCCLVEDLAEQCPQSYDGVVASEILEHVPHPNDFINTCCDLVQPGGSLFVTSLNKTALSRVLGVFAAERIFRLVPVGAHDWNKFVPIDDLQTMIRENGFSIRLLNGMTMNPFTLRWHWFPDNSINYALHAVKNNVTNSDETSSSGSD